VRRTIQKARMKTSRRPSAISRQRPALRLVIPHFSLITLQLCCFLFLEVLAGALTGGAFAGVDLSRTDSAPLDLKGYVTALGACTASVGRLKQHPEEVAPLVGKLPSTWSVSVDGQHFDVSTQWLRSALAAMEKNPGRMGSSLAQIQDRLAAMQDAALAVESGGVDRATARDKLNEILKRREFQGLHGPTWIQRLRQRISYWLTELLDALFSRLAGHPTAAHVFLWGLVIGMVLTLLISMARLILFRSPRVSPLPLEARDSAGTAQSLARSAEAAAAEGRYRDAIRLAYWAGIFRLGEVGVWPVDRTRTHREYLRLLPGEHPQRGALWAMTSCFEQVWYAGQSASPQDFDFIVTQLEKLGCPFPSSPATANS
jgi:uncharacterized protein DUF4129